MAFRITQSCTVCHKCEPLCPTRAINLEDDIYVINERKCVECKGYFDEPQCYVVCPVDVIIKVENETNTSKY